MLTVSIKLTDQLQDTQTNILNESQKVHQLVATHIGRNGFSHSLNFPTFSEQQKWKQDIEKQQKENFSHNSIFIKYFVSQENFENISPNCAAVCESYNILFLGTETGLHAKYLDQNTFTPLLSIEKISKIEIIENCNLVLILSEKTLYTVLLSAITSEQKNLKQYQRKFSSHVSFFEVGNSNEKTLISIIKTTSLSSTIKLYEPSVSLDKNAVNPKTFLFKEKMKMKIFKEFYIPSESFSLYYLKSKLCIGCAKGFEIVDIQTLETQGLLDPSDSELDFVTKKENNRPLSFFKVRDRTFFLCYLDFGFFVNRIGRLVNNLSIIYWKGVPTTFALLDPYILAFNPSFIEIWNLETGNVNQIIKMGSYKVLRSCNKHIIIAEMIDDKLKIFELQTNKNHPYNIIIKNSLRSDKFSKRRGVVCKTNE